MSWLQSPSRWQWLGRSRLSLEKIFRGGYFLLGASLLISGQVTAAEVKGAYPGDKLSSPGRPMPTYNSLYGPTVTEYKIYSDFDFIVWKVIEGSFEDGSSYSVEGPHGLLFSSENGGNWGYSNSRGLSIFFLDNDSLITISGKDGAYERFDFEYDAFLISNNKIFSYRCSFDLDRFRGYRGLIGPNKQFGPGDRLFSRIGKFLAENGVDPGLDKCEEAPELLNVPVVAQAEQDMKELAQARAASN